MFAERAPPFVVVARGPTAAANQPCHMFFREFAHQRLVNEEIKGFGARAISGA